MAGNWSPTATYAAPEAILLASNVQAARGFVGDFDAAPGHGGDCSHFDPSALIEVPMEAGRVYAGNVTMLHYSLPVLKPCLRT
jgi:hypothetical protein